MRIGPWDLDLKPAIRTFFKYYLFILCVYITWKIVTYHPNDNQQRRAEKAKIEPFELGTAQASGAEGAIKVTIVPKEEASLFFLEDADKYVQNMSPSDLYARKVQCQEAYRLQGYYATLQATPEQASIIKDACGKADAFFHTYTKDQSGETTKSLNDLKDMKMIAYFDAGKARDLPWSIILVKDDYEQGLPHTRGKYIIIHPSLLQKPMKELIGTLIHEKIHVYQRKYSKEDATIEGDTSPVKLTDYLVSKMGFVKVKRRSEVSCDIRANPDLDDWVYKDPKTGKDMYLCYKSGNPTGIDDVIGDSREEHPYEYIAYEIASLYENS